MAFGSTDNKFNLPKLTVIDHQPKTSSLRGLEEMRKGLQKYIDGPKYQGTQRPIEILATINKRIANRKGGDVEQMIAEVFKA